jgi:predicted nucleotide-binding protein
MYRIIIIAMIESYGAERHGAKLLVVDDDRYSAEGLATVLSDIAGLDIHIAVTVDEALSATAAQQFDLVITDVMMDPGTFFRSIQTAGGFQTGKFLAREIRRRHPQTKILAFTNSTDAAVQEWFTQNASMAFLEKGVAPRRIKHVVASMLNPNREMPQAFIVHGRDLAAVAELKEYLQNRLGFAEPIVLAEQPSEGRAIIEKFERYAAGADIVFVLLTPDDEGYPAGFPESARRRTRSNVIFELGYFLGLLKRHSGRIVLLYRGDLELPSDLTGICYVEINHGIYAAGEHIRKELSRWLSPPPYRHDSR